MFTARTHTLGLERLNHHPRSTAPPPTHTQVFWSEYTLKTTGCGLPAGPGGALGALEGVSYLVVAGVFLWSIATKVRTGRGLPAGPAGLLGAVEGMSFLAVVAGIVIAGLTYSEYGSIPEAVPVEGGRCSGI